MRAAHVTIILVALLAAVGPLGYASSPVASTPHAPRGSSFLPPGWTNVTSSPSPPSMAGAMMAFSSQDGKFVLFGGWNGTALDATWIFDPVAHTWSEVSADPRPLARGDGTFVYDAVHDAFVLFGGWHEFANETYSRLNDTWLFHLGNRTWFELHTSEAPSPRSDSAIAYDPTDGILLLFGGFDGTSYLEDVWGFNLANGTWYPRPSATLPSRRADARMAYDARDHLFYLFGGNDYSDANRNFHHLGDLWTYSWVTNRWSELSVMNAPEARDYHILVYDPDAAALLLTGGYGNRTILGDTWALDLAAGRWIEVRSTVTPPPRFAGVGGYDTREKCLVIFSGLGNQGLLADTWLLRYQPASGAEAVSSSFGGGPLLVIIILVAIFVVLVTAGARSPSVSSGLPASKELRDEAAESPSGDGEADAGGRR